MTRMLAIVKNVHMIVEFHIRSDIWKPYICYLNATTLIHQNVKPGLLDGGCNCMVTCKFYPKKKYPAMIDYS